MQIGKERFEIRNMELKWNHAFVHAKSDYVQYVSI